VFADHSVVLDEALDEDVPARPGGLQGRDALPVRVHRCLAPSEAHAPSNPEQPPTPRVTPSHTRGAKSISWRPTARATFPLTHLWEPWRSLITQIFILKRTRFFE